MSIKSFLEIYFKRFMNFIERFFVPFIFRIERVANAEICKNEKSDFIFFKYQKI